LVASSGWPNRPQPSVRQSIDLEAEIAYTWADTDPEGGEAADGTDIDNYDALELGIGTTLTF
jgi:outer membrane protein OmpU